MRQGCAVSPWLFNAFTQAVVREGLGWLCRQPSKTGKTGKGGEA